MISIKELQNCYEEMVLLASLKVSSQGKLSHFEMHCRFKMKKVSYKSTIEGVMHACGRNGHNTSSLLGVAKVLSDDGEENDYGISI